MIRILLSILLFSWASCLIGQEDELFRQGNEAYKAKDFALALEQYKELVNQGFTSPELHHNLANTYFKSGQLGKAILYFEKAYRAKPSDKNIKQNLAIAREEIDSPVIEIPEFFLVRYWKGFSGILSPIFWQILQFIATLAFLYGIYIWRMKDTEAHKLKGFMIMLGALLVMLLFFFAGQTAQNQLTNRDSAIIMNTSTLMSAPDARSEEKTTLSEGVKVRIIDGIDDWYKVTLMNKDQGWVSKAALEVI